jgi:hypothetical protein
MNPFEPNPIYSQSHPFGRRFTGNPLLNAGINIAAGEYGIPQPLSGQSMYDNFLVRERSRHFMNLQRSGMMNNMLFKKFGLSDNNTLSAMSMFAMSPESAFNKGMSPMVGGNPVAASMQLYAGLAGANVMGNFGRMGGVTVNETQQMMSSLAKNFYTSQQYEGKGGVREGLDKLTTKKLMNIADAAASSKTASRANTKEAFQKEGLALDDDDIADDGKITEKGRKRLEAVRVTRGSGTDLETHVRESQIARRQKGRSQQETLQEIRKEVQKGDDEMDDALSKATAEKLKKKFALSDEEIKKLIKDSSKSTRLDKNKVLSKINKIDKDVIDKANATTELEDIYNKSAEPSKAGSRYTGFDFVKSRGFKLEDITSGFVKASELRMLGDVKGQSMHTAMGNFSKNAGGAMSAARDVFGDLSGGELVTKISDMMGSSAVDLGSQEGSSKVEELLRKTSATARVAGMSIKAMLSIIDDTKELLAQNPQLQHTNSAAVANIVNDAVLESSQAGTTMTAEEYRSAGGSTGITSRKIKESAAFAQSPLGSSLAASLSYAKSSQNKEAEKYINELVDSGQYTGRNLQGQVGKDIAAKLNMSHMDFLNMARDPLQAREGMKDEGIANIVMGEKGRKLSANAGFDVFARQGISKERIEAEYAKFRRDNPSASASDFEKAYLLPKLKTNRNRAMYETSRGSMMDSLRDSALSPEEKNALKKERDAQVESDKVLSKEFDRVRAAPTTQVIDALLKGSKVEGYDIEEAANALAGIVSSPDQADQVMKEAKEGFKGAVEVLDKNKDTSFANLEDKDKNTVTQGINSLLDLKRKNLEAIDPEKAKNVQAIDSAGIEGIIESLKKNKFASVGSAKDRLAELEKLEKGGVQLDKNQERDLKALRHLKSMDFEGMDDIQKHGAKGYIKALTESTRKDTKAKIVQDRKKVHISSLDEVVNTLSQGKGEEGTQARSLRDEYKDKGGMEKLLKDLQDPEKSEELDKKYKGSRVLSRARDVASRMEQDEAKSLAGDQKKAADKKEDSQKQLIDSLKALNETISSGGQIASTLQQFADSIKSI